MDHRPYPFPFQEPQLSFCRLAGARSGGYGSGRWNGEIPVRELTRKADMVPAIAIDHLVIRYGNFTAVNDLSFEVNRGEVFGLLGPNGAGKTTTFLCLTQQVGISDGKVSILSHDVATDFD